MWEGSCGQEYEADSLGNLAEFCSAIWQTFVRGAVRTYEKSSAKAKQVLRAAALSGAGERGWFGGRKPPLPSRGVVSLQ